MLRCGLLIPKVSSSVVSTMRGCCPSTLTTTCTRAASSSPSCMTLCRDASWKGTPMLSTEPPPSPAGSSSEATARRRSSFASTSSAFSSRTYASNPRKFAAGMSFSRGWPLCRGKATPRTPSMSGIRTSWPARRHTARRALSPSLLFCTRLARDVSSTNFSPSCSAKKIPFNCEVDFVGFETLALFLDFVCFPVTQTDVADWEAFVEDRDAGRFR